MNERKHSVQDQSDPDSMLHRKVKPFSLSNQNSYTSLDVHQLLQQTVNTKSNFLNKVVVVNPNKNQIRMLKQRLMQKGAGVKLNF